MFLFFLLFFFFKCVKLFCHALLSCYDSTDAASAAHEEETLQKQTTNKFHTQAADYCPIFYSTDTTTHKHLLPPAPPPPPPPSF